MSGRQRWLCGFLAAAVLVTFLSQVRWDLMKSPGARAASDPTFADPASLYLVFAERPDPNWPVVMMSLHPSKSRSLFYEQGFAPGHERDASAFVITLLRESPDGYDVSFQPADPETQQPLPVKDVRLFFSRKVDRCFLFRASKPVVARLDSRITVSGFYGSQR